MFLLISLRNENEIILLWREKEHAVVNMLLVHYVCGGIVILPFFFFFSFIKNVLVL